MIYFQETREDIQIELALQWNDGYQEGMFCYTNNIPSATAAPTWQVFAAP